MCDYETEWFKYCPDSFCREIQYYSTKENLLNAIKKNTNCFTCAMKKRRLSPEEKEIIKKERSTKYYKRYEKKQKEYKKKRRKNPEYQKKQKEYNKEYLKRPGVKEKKKEALRKYNRKKRKNPTEKLSHNISGCLLSSLKYRNINKNNRHWETLLINNLQEIIEHLEKNFLPGMSWKNYGKKGWHLDHIIPVSFFKFTSTDDIEFKYCWSIENLQPLWKKDNIKKLDKITLWGKKVNARNLYISGTTQLRVIPNIDI